MTFLRTALLVGVLTFTLFIVIFLPASLVWWFVSDRIPSGLLSLGDISGTPWRGHAQASGRFIPSGEIAWDLHEGDLLTGSVEADLVMEGPGHHLTGTVRWSGDRLDLEHVSGWVEADAVNRKVEPLGYEVSGRLDITELNGSAEARWITSLSGRLHWSGGKLSYTSARSNLLYRLPALSGSLALDAGAIAATVSERDSASELFDFRLQRDGWAKISMRGRLFDLVEQPWPMQGQPGDVVMELESQLWQ